MGKNNTYKNVNLNLFSNSSFLDDYYTLRPPILIQDKEYIDDNDINYLVNSKELKDITLYSINLSFRYKKVSYASPLVNKGNIIELDSNDLNYIVSLVNEDLLENYGLNKNFKKYHEYEFDLNELNLLL